jgi:hypothetical protein
VTVTFFRASGLLCSEVMTYSFGLCDIRQQYVSVHMIRAPARSAGGQIVGGVESPAHIRPYDFAR